MKPTDNDVGLIAQYWPKDWHAFLDHTDLMTMVSFRLLRQFIRAVADQQTNRPSRARVIRETGMHDFQIEYCCAELANAGRKITWKAERTQ
ncbi:MAG TPA: hypothetical protein VHU23_12630 [Rhizomicrobium sp.]|nr:hypothetical protein [Rhizomicrobium sp.]